MRDYHRGRSRQHALNIAKIEKGIEAEEIALQHEYSRLGVGCEGAEFICYVGDDLSKGYDIESPERLSDAKDFRFIEVKALSPDGSFLLTAHETKVLSNLGSKGFLYLVDVDFQRVVNEICDPISFLSRQKFEAEVLRYYL